MRLPGDASGDNLMDETLAELLAQYEAALTNGTAVEFRQQTRIPATIAERFEAACEALEGLHRFWSGDQTVLDTFALRSTDASNAHGRLIGRFRIEQEVGSGGFGIVYLATDLLLNRSVALKVPRFEAAGNQPLHERFLQEAKVAAALDHPHIVPVYEVNAIGNTFYIASAFCPGPNLAQWLTDHKLTCHQTAILVQSLAHALSYCHDRGILHRDLKPANVLLAPGEHRGLPFIPKLTDFGLAKIRESSLADTRSSVMLGTPLYMSPEQALQRSKQYGPATDVYGLGAILYELLSGQPPFFGECLAELLDQVRHDSPRGLRDNDGDVPRDLETICLKCLSKSPTERYPSATALADDLERFLNGATISAKPPGILQRVSQWSRRPERIGQAGVVALVNAVVASGPVVAGVWLVATEGLSFPDPQQTLLGLVKIFLLYCVPQCLIGLFTLRGSRWALWAGALAPIVLVFYVTGIVFGAIDTGGFIGKSEQDRSLLLTVEMLGLGLLFVEFAAYVPALNAYYAKQHHDRLAH